MGEGRLVVVGGTDMIGRTAGVTSTGSNDCDSKVDNLH